MSNADQNSKHRTKESVSLEETVFRALSENGEIIPETAEEVARAEERLRNNPPILPASLKDPKQMLRRIKARKQKEQERASKVVRFPQTASMKIEEEMAWAARNGGEMTPEVHAILRQNREKALQELNKQKLG